MRKLTKSFIERLLAWSARRVIQSTKPTIVGVTGSSGKTSTKEAILHVLRATLTVPVVGAKGNLNSEFGLPLAVLKLPKPESLIGWMSVSIAALKLGWFPPHQSGGVLVLEYGAEYPGDIKKLVAIAQPTVAVVTNVGPAHLEFFKTLDNVAREKVTLILKVPATGRVIANADDQFTDWMSSQTRAEVVRIKVEGGEFAKQAAITVADWFEVDKHIAATVAEGWSPPPGRLVELRGINNSTVLDDTYNANPSSVTLALNTARNLTKKRKLKRLIVVLGDMLELGAEEDRYHQGIALLAQKAADVTVLVGKRFKTMSADQWFDSPQAALPFLRQTIQSGDMILVKGSQGMRMELVTAAILDNPIDAARLVRQSPAWRAKSFIQP